MLLVWVTVPVSSLLVCAGRWTIDTWRRGWRGLPTKLACIYSHSQDGLGTRPVGLPTELCPPPPIRQLYIINKVETNPFHTASMHSETNYVLIIQGLTRVCLRCRCCCLTSTGFTKHFIHVRIHVSATCACMKMEVGRVRGEWRRWGWVRGKMWSW